MNFFEKGGAATAKKASSKAIKMFERGESQKLHGIINLAGEEAQTAYQVGLEAGAEEERRQFKEELESKSFQLSVFQSEVKARDESFKRMERELVNERAKCQVSEAEAKAAEARADAEHLRSEHFRKKAHVFEQRLARSERPFEEEQAAKSTTDQMTWCAAEVEEYESMIGELTEELREFRAKDLEYGRTKAAVANFRGKYAELQSLREEMRRLHKEIERLQAERGSVEEAVKDRISIFLPGDHREVPLNDIKKVGSSKTAPYSAFFSEVIAPAMMNTGASPEQICSVIRKTDAPFPTPAV
jgi:chromosome segregation ATPase